MALGKRVVFTPCYWSSISKELVWKNGKEYPVFAMIEAAIKD